MREDGKVATSDSQNAAKPNGEVARAPQEANQRSDSKGLSVGDEVLYEGTDLNGERGTITGRVLEVSDSGVGVSQPNGSVRYYKESALKKA